MATGLLVVCINAGTKLSQFLVHAEKEYAARIRLGIETDTQDITGRVLGTHEGPLPDRAAFEWAAGAFTGSTEQVPPMYSALKKGGVPLYRLARQGRTVERQARRVFISELEVLSWEPPEASIRVVCSTGTYVRTLCHDIGAALGCGGALSSLERLRSGAFHLGNALPLAGLEELDPGDVLSRHLIGLEEALRDMPGIVVDSALALRLRNGATLTAGEARVLAVPEGGCQMVKISQCGGGLVGIFEPVPNAGAGCESAPAWKSVRVFAEQAQVDRRTGINI